MCELVEFVRMAVVVKFAGKLQSNMVEIGADAKPEVTADHFPDVGKMVGDRSRYQT